jgi:hypothetical protein
MHGSSKILLALYVTDKCGVEAGGAHASKTAKLGSRFRDGAEVDQSPPTAAMLSQPDISCATGKDIRLRLTSDVCESTFVALGVKPVKRRRRMLVLFVLAGVFGGSVVPPLDLPETSFNESDAPVNLATPSQATVTFVRPLSEPLFMRTSWFYCAGCDTSSRTPEAAAGARQRHPHSFQDLLCTFLI